jgi:hypothetical protein
LAYVNLYNKKGGKFSPDKANFRVEESDSGEDEEDLLRTPGHLTGNDESGAYSSFIKRAIAKSKREAARNK